MPEETGHLTPAGLGRLLREELPAPQVVELFRHLARGCAACGSLLAPFVGLSPAQGPPAEADRPGIDRYELPFARVFASVRRQATELGRERAAARLELLRILARGRERAAALKSALEGAAPRTRWVWCELLAETAPELRRDSPQDALAFAEVAVSLATDLVPGDFPADVLADLQARAWMELGNLRRVREDFSGAETAFQKSLERLAAGTRNPLLMARFLDLTGSLLRALRCFREALDVLDRARRIYTACEQPHFAGRILVKSGIALLYWGEPDRAVQALDKALVLLEPERDPSLLLAAVHSFLLAWTEAGEPERAARTLWNARKLYAALGTEQERPRLLALEGCIAREMGDLKRAERFFRQAKESYEATQQTFVAAITALDLASVLLADGRPAEVVGLVNEMLITFLALRIEREALAAVVVLHQAVLQGTATPELARAVAREIRRLTA